MFKKIRYILFFLGAMTISLSAAPSVYGPTGLVGIPTAEYLQFRETGLGVDFLTSSTTPKTDSYFYKINMGTYKNWELGVVAGKVPTEGAFINIKYYLTAEGERFPISIALGVQNLFSQEKTDLYMVASKRFPSQFSLHFGFKANFGKTEVFPSLIGGIEYFISNHVSLLGDVSGEKSLYKFNAGMRVVLADTLLLHLSALDIGNASREGTMLGAGLSYSAFL